VKERIQKILAARGVASRRNAEQIILAGRVSCNGQICKLGDTADMQIDTLLLDGKPLPDKSESVYLMLHKPRGYVTTLSDEKGRKNAAMLVSDCQMRVYPVGRLDYNSEGLLILTNDGELTNRLTHPSHSVGKQYIVKVRGDVDAALTRLRLPFELDGRETAPAQINVLAEDARGGLLSFTIYEGRNRQIRRMCEESGLDVCRLKRVAVGRLELGKLPGGRWRYLTEDEIEYLKSL